MIAHQMLDIFLGNWEKSVLLLGYSNKHFREPLYSETVKHSNTYFQNFREELRTQKGKKSRKNPQTLF